MYNPITKAVRYLQREYPEQYSFNLLFTGICFGVALFSGLMAGAPLFMIPLMGLGMGAFGAAFNLVSGEQGRGNGNAADVNGFKIIGKPRDVDSVVMTQRLVSSLTANQAHLAELPARLTHKIARHLEDIAPAFARLRMTDAAGQPATDFFFTRSMIDAAGKSVTQRLDTAMAASTDVPHAPEAPVPAPRSPAPNLTTEFGALAQKVEKVEQRVGQLENPAPVQLDKPKLAKTA